MIYRAVGNRCGFNPLFLLIVEPDIVSLMLTSGSLASIAKLFFKEEYGIRVIKVDMIGVARELLGKPTYQVRAKFSEAPWIVDCSSFVKWVYAQRGIWLPRLSIQQRNFGATFGPNVSQEICPNDLLPCDLVFTEGPWYLDDSKNNVGHVGIVADNKTVIHAIGKAGTVIESPLVEFFGEHFRGAIRLIPYDSEIITLEIPPRMEIETSDDLSWLIARDFQGWLAKRNKSLEIPC